MLFWQNRKAASRKFAKTLFTEYTTTQASEAQKLKASVAGKEVKEEEKKASKTERIEKKASMKAHKREGK